jgi:ATPase subunit of ABC transporter with duplicated ATPase domains
LTHPSDIKITGYTMGLNGVELIKECSIELTIGRRYGLIGQNGSGKTNFLQCIANREVGHPLGGLVMGASGKGGVGAGDQLPAVHR